MLNRILKGIIAFVLLSLAYVVYMGTANKEGTVVTEMKIDATTEEVYSILTDPAKAEDWLLGLIEMEQIAGNGMAVGAEFKLLMLEGGKNFEMIQTITDLQQNRRFSFDFNTDFLASQHDIILSASGDGTLLKEVNTYSGKNFITRAMTGRRNVKQRQKMIYEKLKDVAEK